MSSSSLRPAPAASVSPLTPGPRGASGAVSEPGLWPAPVWVLVAVAVLGASVAIALGSGMTPSYDPYGWLVWGHQVLHGHLNLNAAPSWKPLTFIFTLPYALFSTSTAPKLWSITAVAGTLSMAVFAARIAYRLARPPAGAGGWRVAAAWIGALFAAVAVLGMQGLSHLMFIANSDPLNTALVLAAVDAHLSRRPRLAYVVLFFAALGRPEVWPFAFLYGVYLLWKVPRSRVLVVAGWALILACWFIPTALAAKSVFQAGQLDLGKSTAIHGNKIVGVFSRWVAFYEWPMQLAVLLGLAIGLLRRDRRVLGLAGLSLLWVFVEIAFAYHGFSAVARYVMEPAAVMLTLGGFAVAELLAGLPGRFDHAAARRLSLVAGPLVVLGIWGALVPFAHLRQFRIREQLPAVRNFGVRVDHLAAAVRRAGGRRTILACGEVAAKNQYQSQLAWQMGVNVSAVYFNPSLLIRIHRRMVLFTEVGLNGWQVKPYNVPAGLAAHCQGAVASS